MAAVIPRLRDNSTNLPSTPAMSERWMTKGKRPASYTWKDLSAPPGTAGAASSQESAMRMFVRYVMAPTQPSCVRNIISLAR